MAQFQFENSKYSDEQMKEFYALGAKWIAPADGTVCFVNPTEEQKQIMISRGYKMRTFLYRVEVEFYK